MTAYTLDEIADKVAELALTKVLADSSIADEAAHWQDVRSRAAIAIEAARMGAGFQDHPRGSVMLADALVAALKGAKP
jgi:predicted dienelactone hydrolase